MNDLPIVTPYNSLNSLRVFAVMLFPDSEELQNGFLAQTLAPGLIEVGVPVPQEFIPYLLVPSIEEEKSKRISRGWIAGSVLSWLHYLSENGADEPSMRKAYYLTAQDRCATTNGQGQKLTTSDPHLRKSFDQFSAVAHLWAALVEIRATEALKRLPTPPSERIPWDGDDVRDAMAEFFYEESKFLLFLAVAERLREFGESFTPTRDRQQKTALNRAITMKVPPGIELPDVYFQSDGLGTWAERALGNYHHAKRDIT